MTFYIDTQYLENYGIHTDNATGKFADDQARWKFKFGDTYAVTGLDRVQDAVAFVCTRDRIKVRSARHGNLNRNIKLILIR